MTLYRHALRQAWLSWLIWAVAVALYILVVISATPAISIDPHLFASVMAAFPPRLLALFGGQLLLRHPVDSYLDAKLLAYLPLFGALLAAFQAAAVARDVERGRSDFLLALPVPRRAIVFGRMAALLTVIVLYWVVALVALGLCMRAYHLAIAWPSYLTLGYAGFLVDSVLAVAALGLSLHARTYRDAVRLTLGVALVPLICDYALQMALVPRGWRYVLPYGYYDPQTALLGHPFAWAATLVLIPAVVVIAILGQRAFERREV
jgi:ABC-2 type transport system permease protein